MPMWGYYMNGAGMGWWMVLSSLFWLVLAGVVVWALVRWVSNASRPTGPHAPEVPTGPQPPALDILKARYARGEIDAATFQTMRAQLEETPTLPPPAPAPREPVSSGR